MNRKLALDQTIENLIGGLADNKTYQDIAKKHGVSPEHIQHQINMGEKIEREHTTEKANAKEIAKDHLWENPDYYTYLTEMEKRFKKKDAGKTPGIPDATGPYGRGMGPGKGRGDGTGMGVGPDVIIHSIETSPELSERDEEIIQRDLELEQAAIDEYQGQLPDASSSLKKVLTHLIREEEEHKKKLEEVLRGGEVENEIEPSIKSGSEKSKQKWISNKIRILMNEGKPQDQAAAIAYSMYDKKSMRSATLMIIKQAVSLLGDQVNQEALKKLQEKYKMKQPITVQDIGKVIGMNAAQTLNMTTDLTLQQIAEQLLFFDRTAREIQQEIAHKGYGLKPPRRVNLPQETSTT